MRLLPKLVLMCIGAIAIACETTSEAPTAPLPATALSAYPCSYNSPDEGEILGMIYHGGVPISDCGRYVVTLGTQMSAYPSGNSRNGNWPWHFEWMDNANSGNPCGAKGNEVHLGSGGTIDDEQHCVSTGQHYFLTVKDTWPWGVTRTLPLDYLKKISVSPSIGGIVVTVPSSVALPYSDNWVDAVVSIDLGADPHRPGPTYAYSSTARLGIHNVGRMVDRSISFTDEPTPSGTNLDWFRFSADNSTSTTSSSGDAREVALARLHFSGRGLSYSTGYYSFRGPFAHVLRSFKFEDLIDSPGNMSLEARPEVGDTVPYYVTLELLDQNRDPGSLSAVPASSLDTDTIQIAFEQPADEPDDPDEPDPTSDVSIDGDTWVNDTEPRAYYATDGRGNPVNGNWSMSVDGGPWSSVGKTSWSSVGVYWPRGTYTGRLRHVSATDVATLSVEVCDRCSGPQRPD